MTDVRVTVLHGTTYHRPQALFDIREVPPADPPPPWWFRLLVRLGLYR